jgi:hypothetical protein
MRFGHLTAAKMSIDVVLSCDVVWIGLYRPEDQRRHLTSRLRTGCRVEYLALIEGISRWRNT